MAARRWSAWPFFILAATLAAGACAQDGEGASRADFERRGLVWPFTVDRVRLGCDDISKLWVKAEGRRYALNGRARSRYPYADPVLRVDERLMRAYRAVGDTNPYEVRIDPSDAMGEARKTCQPQ